MSRFRVGIPAPVASVKFLMFPPAVRAGHAARRARSAAVLLRLSGRRGDRHDIEGDADAVLSALEGEDAVPERRYAAERKTGLGLVSTPAACSRQTNRSGVMPKWADAAACDRRRRRIQASAGRGSSSALPNHAASSS